jgi:hypothetical protein
VSFPAKDCPRITSISGYYLGGSDQHHTSSAASAQRYDTVVKTGSITFLTNKFELLLPLLAFDQIVHSLKRFYQRLFVFLLFILLRCL